MGSEMCIRDRKNPCHSLFSGGDHLRFTSGIICGLGSFAVQFGDHFRSGDHLRSGIICGAVQMSVISENLRPIYRTVSDEFCLKECTGSERFCHPAI